MGFTTYNLGLTIKQPTRGTTGYYSTLDTDTYTKISQHDHTGSGRGAQIGTAALVDSSVTTVKILDSNITTAKIANDAVTYAKIQNVSATDRLLGRSTSGAGDVEEIICTAAGRALIDDADATAQRATLGLGTIATQAANSVSISGGSITGITDLAIADGGTGASTAAAAFAALAAGLTWSAFSPSLSGDGTGSITSTAIVRGRFCQINKLVNFLLEFTGTIVTADVFWVGFSLPVAAVNRSGVNWDASVMSSALNADSLSLLGDLSGARGYLYDTNTGIIRRANNKLTNGVAYRFIVSGCYEAA